jgi:hypothetical protein
MNNKQKLMISLSIASFLVNCQPSLAQSNKPVNNNPQQREIHQVETDSVNNRRNILPLDFPPKEPPNKGTPPASEGIGSRGGSHSEETESDCTSHTEEMSDDNNLDNIRTDCSEGESSDRLQK